MRNIYNNFYYLALLLTLTHFPVFGQSDFDIVKGRITKELMQPPVDDERVEKIDQYLKRGWHMAWDQL
jgi:hypothetical protein